MEDAKRAIFLAAGLGSRLRPLTYVTPKPLIKINGVRIIDSMIDSMISAGIEEIYIVRGYLKEEFDQLLDKYPMIRFIDNPFYENTNNISSGVLASKYFENAYVCESDIYIRNPNIIRRSHETSEVLGIKVTSTDDWCYTANESGYMLSQEIGGVNCYKEVGIFYLNKEDGNRLADHILMTYYSPNGHSKFWEWAMTTGFKSEYKLKVVECLPEDIMEIDTLSELKSIDKSYN